MASVRAELSSDFQQEPRAGHEASVVPAAQKKGDPGEDVKTQRRTETQNELLGPLRCPAYGSRTWLLAAPFTKTEGRTAVFG